MWLASFLIILYRSTNNYLPSQVINNDQAINHITKPIEKSMKPFTLGLLSCTDSFAAPNANVENQVIDAEIAPIKK